MHLCIIFQGDFAINTDGGLLDIGLLFGGEFPDLGDLSPPHCESSSSDSYMTPSPNTVDDELLEILSSTSTSPGLPQNSEDVAIDLGKWSSKKKKSVCTEWIFHSQALILITICHTIFMILYSKNLIFDQSIILSLIIFLIPITCLHEIVKTHSVLVTHWS